MKCFIKNDKLSEASDDKLSRILEDRDNRLEYKKVNLGFLTEKYLKEASKKARVSERQVMEFRMSVMKFLEELVKKVLNKCPLSYSLVRNLSSLNPKAMAARPDECRAHFKKVIALLECNKKVREEDCDCILIQYGHFLDQIPVIGSEQFAGFSHQSEHDRVDTFFMTHLQGEDKYSQLVKVIKLILVLSHGQASVERGFSINKQLEVENLKEESLVAQRLVCDHVRAAGGIMNINISKSLLNSASMARHRYEQYLEKERRSKKTAEEQRKRKATLDQMDELKVKKQRLLSDISALTQSADEMAEKAESTSNLTFLAKSNAYRRSVKDKQGILVSVEDSMTAKLEELKQWSEQLWTIVQGYVHMTVYIE